MYVFPGVSAAVAAPTDLLDNERWSLVHPRVFQSEGVQVVGHVPDLPVCVCVCTDGEREKCPLGPLMGGWGRWVDVPERIVYAFGWCPC